MEPTESFLESHQKSCEHNFWYSIQKSMLIHLTLISYKKHVVREWGISNIIDNQDKVLIHWHKRPTPLTDEQLEELYRYK